jgi:ankyrin repeat protein
MLPPTPAALSPGAASDACKLIYPSPTPRLPSRSRLITAGADANATDYDQRTALHIAAADGNLSAVKVLVEQGKARTYVKDRRVAGSWRTGRRWPRSVCYMRPVGAARCTPPTGAPRAHWALS